MNLRAFFVPTSVMVAVVASGCGAERSRGGPSGAGLIIGGEQDAGPRTPPFSCQDPAARHCGDSDGFGDVRIDCASELAAFVGCPVVDGNLLVSGHDGFEQIIDLRPLGALRWVPEIRLDSIKAANLDGLENLSFVNAITVANDPALVDVSALNGIRTKLTLSNDDALVEVGSGPFVTGSLILDHDSALVSLSNIELLSPQVALTNNDAIVDVPHFSPILAEGPVVVLEDDRNLTSLAGFETLIASMVSC